MALDRNCPDLKILSRYLHTETRYRPQIPDLESKQAPTASPKGGQRPADSSHVYGLLFQVWGVSLTNGFMIVTSSLLKKKIFVPTIKIT